MSCIVCHLFNNSKLRIMLSFKMKYIAVSRKLITTEKKWVNSDSVEKKKPIILNVTVDLKKLKLID